jgi:hypothetical protein
MRHGRDGLPGPRGPEGAPGQDGKNGRDGRDGRDGKDADVDELQKRILPDVIAAIPVPKDGLDGERGEKGDPGERGFQGEKGERGERGPMGIRGKEGPAGRDAEPMGPATATFEREGEKLKLITIAPDMVGAVMLVEPTYQGNHIASARITFMA